MSLIRKVMSLFRGNRYQVSLFYPTLVLTGKQTSILSRSMSDFVRLSLDGPDHYCDFVSSNQPALRLKQSALRFHRINTSAAHRVLKSSPVHLFCHLWPGLELGPVSETPSNQFFLDWTAVFGPANPLMMRLDWKWPVMTSLWPVMTSLWPVFCIKISLNWHLP